MSDRVVLTVSYYSSAENGFKRRHKIMYSDLRQMMMFDGSVSSPGLTVKLRRGGKIRLFANLVHHETCHEIRTDIDNSTLLRRYEFRRFLEKRLHFLLHSNATDNAEDSQPGYKYHGVNLKAAPMSLIPSVEQLADVLAQAFGVENWGVGVDVLIYRNHDDGMGWHADDTHEESIILSVTVASPALPRCVQIKPKTEPYSDGDEFIEIYPGEGDSYTMDGVMQQNYVHGVPTRSKKASGSAGTDEEKRYTLIFRDGKEAMVENDSGQAIDNTLPDEPKELIFGRHDKVLVEGGLSKRIDMVLNGSHGSDFQGVSGNTREGSNAIVIAMQDEFCSSQDHFFSFLYVATTKQRANALYSSYSRRLSIRVFRSSSFVSSVFAPELPAGEKSAVYRYDGLYYIYDVRDDDDQKVATTTQLPTSQMVYRFYFRRTPAGKNGNEWNEKKHLARCLRMGTLKPCAGRMLRFSDEAEYNLAIQEAVVTTGIRHSPLDTIELDS